MNSVSEVAETGVSDERLNMSVNHVFDINKTSLVPVVVSVNVDETDTTNFNHLIMSYRQKHSLR